MAGTMKLGTTHRRLNEKALEHGVERECPYRPGLIVTILPAERYNPRYQQASEKWALRARARFPGDEQEDREQRGEFFLARLSEPEFVVEALVADMGPITDAEGEELEYTPELGVEILSDPGHADVLLWIKQQAQNQDHFYTEDVEDTAKN